MHFDLVQFITTVGYLGVFGIIFAESGLLIGILLPGDSLLFTAGLLAYKGVLNIYWLVLVCFLAAVLGDSFGYMFGHRVGRRLFQRKDSFFFSHENLEKTQQFYDKYGPATIILARFVPIVRTFAPIIAGVSKMKYTTFLSFNIVGGLLWAVGITVAGYYLGSVVPDIDKYLLPIIILIILISVGPGVYHLLKTKQQREAAISALKESWRHIKKKFVSKKV
jgi:membrane-associated protein